MPKRPPPTPPKPAPRPRPAPEKFEKFFVREGVGRQYGKDVVVRGTSAKRRITEKIYGRSGTKTSKAPPHAIKTSKRPTDIAVNLARRELRLRLEAALQTSSMRAIWENLTETGRRALAEFLVVTMKGALDAFGGHPMTKRELMQIVEDVFESMD